MHLHHRDIGEGTPLFCLHGGMGLDHHVFLPWLQDLGAGIRTVLFDFSGNGASRPDLPAEDMSHRAWVDDIESLRRHLGLEQIAVLGHSYGGFLAQEYALLHPERVSRLILANTAPVVDFGEAIVANAQARGTPEQVELAMRILTSPVDGDKEFEDAFRVLLPLYFHRWDPEVGEQLLEGVRYRADAFNVGNGWELPTFDTRDQLGGLDIPTLVLSSSDDWIMPQEHGGRRLAELIPGARHVVLDECGHFAYVEQTQRFVESVRAFVLEASA